MTDGTSNTLMAAEGYFEHTRWANGGVYYSGFTAAMPPNMKVLAASRAFAYSTNGQTFPMDRDSIDENDGGPTYMSLAASSEAPGGANTGLADFNELVPILAEGQRESAHSRPNTPVSS